jgi:hypothetical protein
MGRRSLSPNLYQNPHRDLNHKKEKKAIPAINLQEYQSDRVKVRNYVSTGASNSGDRPTSDQSGQ